MHDIFGSGGGIKSKDELFAPRAWALSLLKPSTSCFASGQGINLVRIRFGITPISPSGVAGDAVPPAGPHRQTPPPASRIASRTEMASISGGSPRPCCRESFGCARIAQERHAEIARPVAHGGESCKCPARCVSGTPSLFHTSSSHVNQPRPASRPQLSYGAVNRRCRRHYKYPCATAASHAREAVPPPLPSLTAAPT